MKKLYLALLKSDDKVYLMLNPETTPPCILGFSSRRKGLAYFENAFANAHARSHVASMSACIYVIHFQPCIIEVPDLDYIEKNIIDMRNRQPYELSGEAGTVMVAKTCAKAKELWKKGIKPRLDAGMH